MAALHSVAHAHIDIVLDVSFDSLIQRLFIIINARRSTEFSPGTIMKLSDAIWMMGSAITFIIMTDTATGKYV